MLFYFQSYSGRLLKLQFDETATRDDLMGLDDTAPRSSLVGSSLSGVFGHRASAVKSKASVWSMGARADAVLGGDALEAPILVPHHHDKKAEAKYPYEVLFRSEQYGFLENACREFVFITEFFILQGSEAMEIFNQISRRCRR